MCIRLGFRRKCTISQISNLIERHIDNQMQLIQWPLFPLKIINSNHKKKQSTKCDYSFDYQSLSRNWLHQQQKTPKVQLPWGLSMELVNGLEPPTGWLQIGWPSLFIFWYRTLFLITFKLYTKLFVKSRTATKNNFRRNVFYFINIISFILLLYLNFFHKY